MATSHPPSRPSKKNNSVAAPKQLVQTRLELCLPDALLVDRTWLARHGFNRARVDAFVRSGRLMAVAHGVYRRPGPALKWEHVVYSLQVLGYPIHVAGRTALDLQGYTHYLPFNSDAQVLVDVACEPSLASQPSLPRWFASLREPVQFVLHRRAWFADLPADAVLTQPLGHWDWPLRVATPELALLELLLTVQSGPGASAALQMMDKYFEAAVVLRPALLTALLRACQRVVPKRLLLWFATRHAHPWLSQLDLTQVDLGKGKCQVVPGGYFDSQFQITVPRELSHGS